MSYFWKKKVSSIFGWAIIMTCESNEGTTSNLAWPQSKCLTEQRVLVFFLELLSVFLIGLSSPLWPSGCWGQDSKDLEALTFPLLFWCVFVVLMFLLSHFLLVEWGCLPCWGLLWLFGTKLSQLGNLDGWIDWFLFSLSLSLTLYRPSHLQNLSGEKRISKAPP